MIPALLILIALGCLDTFGLAAGVWGLVWLAAHGTVGVTGAMVLAPLVLWTVAAVTVRVTRPVLGWLLAEADEAVGEAVEEAAAPEPVAARLAGESC